jgi:hypothetical protein
MNLSSSLQSRLELARPSLTRSAIISTVGPEGSGKTRFALSAAIAGKLSKAGRTVYIGMDRKPVGRSINELLEKYGILRPKTNFKALMNGKAFSQDKGAKMWDELSGLLQDVLADPGCGPTIVDTGTYMWALLRMARFGKLTQVLPHHYGPVNSELETLFYKAEEYGKILIVIHKQSKEYKAGKDGKENWTGRYERAGYSHMGFVANVSLEHYRTESQGFGVRVLQNKITPELDGTVLEDEMCQFGVLAWQTFGEPNGEELEDWIG